MPERILSISGLRGVIGDGLDPEYVTRFAMALGTMANGGAVVLSRDGRSTGEMIRHAVLSGLQATGCRVIDLGIAATPTCGVLVQRLNAAAGLQITASHNPVEWNGLKPFSSRGSVLNQTEGEELVQLMESGQFHLSAWNEVGTVETFEDPGAVHLERVLSLVDLAAIRARSWHVILDANHGSGGVLGPRLLEELGCEVQVLGGTPNGQFEHPPEPVAAHLTGLCEAVRRSGADIGFAQDPDADRLAIVDETGRFIGEELTLALSADFVLSSTPGPLVVNGSTSRVNADIAARHNCDFHRSHVGEANVVAKMHDVGAILGGEGNGGVIEPRVGLVRDSFVGMAYALAGMTEQETPLSAWVDSLPRYAIVKDKITCVRGKVDSACTALESAYSDATPTHGDGLRLDWPDRWVQVRASNTEPIIRVIAEAPDEDAAVALCQEALGIIRPVVS